ncbi:FHA domain-containing protein [Acidicapsa dinghuensis]|uniref:FHA domain-containing protein n=1 Tax=Acidicapsa dinghuensis TaxID=2218256 RepID=A0ABW1EPH1_9BACT|nr:FHA domain-containing protein [Acidicapsa dinghuensis]
MIHCSKCNYGWNPDTATTCVQCKSPLEQSSAVKRNDTITEDMATPDPMRRPTIAEGVSSTPAYSPRSSDPSIYTQPSVAPPSGANAPMTPPSVPRWNDTPPNEEVQRRRTVFAGVSPTPDFQSPAASKPAAAPLAAGSRGRTVAVDPARKIVGVLITYSWQESGQVFPVLEGRNLIGKDPTQSDICIPQDATLSSVNTFITYRKSFVIGDKGSMNGTDVDGEPVEKEFVPLRNYAQIRTGSTYWTFVSIQQSSEVATDVGGSGA